MNFNVTRADALPTLGRQVEWETMYDHDGIVIQVASQESLLAMKLRANRLGRDTRDIRLLLALCEVASLEEAEAFYEDFYPGDGLTSRAISMVTAIFADGPLGRPQPLPPITL